MRIEDEVFARLRPDFSRFKAAGFTKHGAAWTIERDLPGGEFTAKISVSEAGKVTGCLFDKEFGDEYLAVHIPSQSGAFVASVRAAYIGVLRELAAACFIPKPFKGDVANALAARIFAAYGDTPECPFEDDGGGVWREPRTKKWYGLVMEIPREKLEPGADGSCEILNVKVDPAKIDDLLGRPGIYRCYHMNKKHWVTIALDGTVPDAKLDEMISVSRNFAAGGTAKSAPFEASPGDWIVPANPYYFDLYEVFEKEPTHDWVQTATGIQPGDRVWLYVGAPYSAICFLFKVLETNLTRNWDGCDRRAMKITLVRSFPREMFPLSLLRECGVRGVRSARRMTAALKDRIELIVKSE